MKPSELLTRLDERQQRIDEKLEKILEQTTLTNGRVSKLEQWRSKLNGIWFAILTIGGGAATLGGLLIALFTILAE
jgi:hypothetical protein